jgi:ATP-binding protein involved in chromosome partitioning
VAEESKTHSSSPDDDLRSKVEKETKRRLQEKLAPVKHIIIVLSGKGGVGKSSVTVNIASSLVADGKTKVGIFDADFTGPVIPIMMGLRGRKLEREGADAKALIGPLGIKIASLGFFIPEGVPYTLRGVVKYEVLREFLGQVIWGDLDYLIFDLPPGTSDDALNVSLSLPRVDGAVIVTIPTEVSAMPVQKSIVFCKEYNIRVLGVVQNMSSLVCPHCGEVIEIFGSGGQGQALAKIEKVPMLGEVPFDPRMAWIADTGVPFVAKYPDSPTAESFRKISDQIRKAFS